MNILFVNYGDFTTNSLNHISGFANELVARGHACVVAVPSGLDTLSTVLNPRFIPVLYSEALTRRDLFPDARPADVIHAWTPREGVRRFVQAYQSLFDTPPRLLIHLEDNEEHLIATYTGRSIQDLESMGHREVDEQIIDALPHPRHHRDFLGLADGVTVIIDKLKEFVPLDIPTHLLFPGVDFQVYHPAAPDEALRASLGLRDDEKVIVFTGSNTFANQGEIRELYVAVELLNQQGIPTRLLRTGFNHPRFLEGLTEGLKRHVLDLGFVDKAKLPALLSLADVLVQPGVPGAFNDYRLPSKLPEFLASGRPLLLPRSNIGLLIEDGVQARLLKTGSPQDIADGVRAMLASPDVAAALGREAYAFATTHFDLARNTVALEGFYENLRVRNGKRAEVRLALAQADLRRLAGKVLPVLESRIQTIVLTENHARNLEQILAKERGERETSQLLTSQHIQNLEQQAAGLRAHLDVERQRFSEELHLTRQHAHNLDLQLESLRNQATTEQKRFAKELELARQHTRNLENSFHETVAANAAAAARMSGELSLTRQHAANLEKHHEDSQKGLADAREQLLLERAAHTESRNTAALRLAGEREQHEHLRAHLQREIDLTRQNADSLRVLSDSRAAALDASEARVALANKRVAETEALARAKLDELAGKAAAQKDLTRQREEKIRRMQESFSWRCTAPLRALRRLLLDQNSVGTPQPAPPKISTAAAPASPPLIAPPVIAAFRAPACEPPPLPGLRRRAYTSSIDHPKTWTVTGPFLHLHGWCFEIGGSPILGIRARVGTEVFTGTYGAARADVLTAFPTKPHAEHSDFRVDAKVAPGDYDLTLEVLHEDGWAPFLETRAVIEAPVASLQATDYAKWFTSVEALSADDLRAIDAHIQNLPQRPLISIVVPVYNPPRDFFLKTLESVKAQHYPHWELCLADDASTEPWVKDLLKDFAASDARVKVVFRETNGHISNASNSALDLATGDWVALFDHDDVLHPTALYEIACEVNEHPDARFIYTDEDKIDTEDVRFDPYFKPDWNPELLNGQNYTSHLSVFRRDTITAVGGFRTGFEGSQDWDLTLRITESLPAEAIRHIPKILYHWRAIPGSTAFQITEKSYPVEAARRALQSHFERLAVAVELSLVEGAHWRVKYPVPSPAPKVSLIIPTRNAARLVRQAISSIQEKTTYPNYEILLIDNGSDDPEALAYFASLAEPVRVLRYDAPFNYSAINNFAVGHARGELVGLINNDIEVITPGWLDELVSHAVRPGIGAVGALLYYPADLIQHAGVVLGIGGVAGHGFKNYPRGAEGQKNRLRLAQNFSAVTGACLLVKKEAFEQVGGLDEKNLPIAFNDVDFCCKLLEAGYRNLWTPHAELYHHESATRGLEDTPQKQERFRVEVEYMRARWGAFLDNDPAYNPNLTLVSEDFSTAYSPRTARRWQTISSLPSIS